MIKCAFKPTLLTFQRNTWCIHKVRDQHCASLSIVLDISLVLVTVFPTLNLLGQKDPSSYITSGVWREFLSQYSDGAEGQSLRYTHGCRHPNHTCSNYDNLHLLHSGVLLQQWIRCLGLGTKLYISSGKLTLSLLDSFRLIN